MNNNKEKEAPTESETMNNNDSCDENYFEESATDPTFENTGTYESASATNPNVVITQSQVDIDQDDKSNRHSIHTVKNVSDSISEEKNDNTRESRTETTNTDEERNVMNLEADLKIVVTKKNDVKNNKLKDRKLSLDHTVLSRSEGLSQSELCLNTIGRVPLERKSSFFRKKMDSFLRNTTEMFKRQSKTIERRPSMSISLQCLNDKTNTSNQDRTESVSCDQQDSPQNNTSNLIRVPPIVRSVSSLSMCHSAQLLRQNSAQSLTASQPVLHAVSNPTLENAHSDSSQSLNETYLREAMLKSRAISMSSGLDAPMGLQGRKASRSNRVTWLASEGLTNYFRRIIQDEKTTEMKGCQSYQDFSCIPENESYTRKPDSKGRRLSYQKAVSGEDPVQSTRYPDSTMRRRNPIPESSEACCDLINHLSEFTLNGVPALRGFVVADIPDEAFAYLMWAEKLNTIEDLFDGSTLTLKEQLRQAALQELIQTEAEYIKHLCSIVEVFIAAAQALQDMGKMLEVDIDRLFCNLPELLNASLRFWHITFYPMIVETVVNAQPFNAEFMICGFSRFREVLVPYEKFVMEQSKITEYLRRIAPDPEFSHYLSWCYSNKACQRLQLSDFLVKPLQRLTKYELILSRIKRDTDTDSERTALMAMVNFARGFVADVNRSVQRREEIEKVDELSNTIEPYEIDFKDEDMERNFKLHAQLNLKHPMMYCDPYNARSIIYHGDLKFKDHIKEHDVHVFLLTDMMLICKKSKSHLPYRLIRPKYMTYNLIYTPKYDSKKEICGLMFVAVDDVGSSYASFRLSESSKEPSPSKTMKTWDYHVKLGKIVYEVSVEYTRNPSVLNESEMDGDSSADLGSSKGRSMSEHAMMEIEARERVAVMTHRTMTASNECDYSHATYDTDSFDAGSGRRQYIHGLRYNLHRGSTSSRNSRMSSFQHSTSATSHDEPGPSKNVYRPSSSIERRTTPPHIGALTSITVQVVSESESENVDSSRPDSPVPAKTSGQTTTLSTLKIPPLKDISALPHSLPDLTIEPCTPRSASSLSGTSPSTSDTLYKSQLDVMQENRFLSPDRRGSSYPPLSPIKGSLTRGLAFSYSFKNPPLSKMGHVHSQSQVQDTTDRSSSPKPSTSSDKNDRKAEEVRIRIEDEADNIEAGPSQVLKKY